MRLRYLYLPDFPPLREVRVRFGHDQILERACAIRFVVGVNGTGKSRLLQALTEVFLQLEARRVPSFPVLLVYDIGVGAEARSIGLRHLGTAASQAQFVEFAELLPEDTNWDALAATDWMTGDLPAPVREPRYSGADLPATGNMGIYLPRVLLAYTSGEIQSWIKLFRPPVSGDTLNEQEQERPFGWTRSDEVDLLIRSGQSPSAELQRDFQVGQNRSLGVFVPPHRLKLAVCAMALYQAAQDFRSIDEQGEETFLAAIEESIENNIRMPGLRGIFNEVDWLWPVTVGLRLNLDPSRLNDRQRQDVLRLYQGGLSTADPTAAARVTTVVRDPEGTHGRLLVYDLRRPVSDYPATDNRTITALIEAIGGRSDATPFEIFQQLDLWQQEGLLTNVHITVRKHQVNDLLLYDWFSDGEQVFLGRMALFHLLQGLDDTLVLLDEPETHFNDVWKREIVSIIDTILGDTASDVIISTHSSITLSDVSNEEIELLYKQNGQTIADHIYTPTFGADPSQIIVQVFGAEGSIGRRSLERLRALLNRDWQTEDLDQLEQLIQQIGSGYHRSQLRTIWRELRDTRR